MSKAELTRAHIDALLPPGPLWNVKPGGNLDKLLDGAAENHGEVAQFVCDLRFIRDPRRTPFLRDLEREFGRRPGVGETEKERRERLRAIKFRAERSGDIDTFREQIGRLGLNLFVYDNSPAVDPTEFVRLPYLLLVNGFRIDLQITPPVPDDDKSGPFFVFVGGEATFAEEGYNDGDAGIYKDDLGNAYISGDPGQIAAIQPVSLPPEVAPTLSRIIMRFLPLHCWCVLAVGFVEPMVDDLGTRYVDESGTKYLTETPTITA